MIYAHLDPEALKNIGVKLEKDGFVEEQDSPFGHAIFGDEGDLHTLVNGDILQAEWRYDPKLVRFFSYVTSFPANPRRCCGIYRHGSAVAELNIRQGGNSRNAFWEHVLRLTYTDFADGQELYRRIRGGTIWPENKENWDAKQVQPAQLPARVVNRAEVIQRIRENL